MLSDKTIKRNPPDAIYWRAVYWARMKLSARKRKVLNEHIIDQLGDAKFTLFSNNCLAGYFYHDAKREFTTPTINMAFDGEDYIRFLEDPKRYVYGTLSFIETDEVSYPVAHIDDIEVRFVHYHTHEECINAWKRRSDRILWDHIFVIATDHDGMNRPDLLERFDKLPYKKIMYTAARKLEYPWQVQVPQFVGKDQLKIITNIANFRGYRYYECFDIAKWISENSN